MGRVGDFLDEDVFFSPKCNLWTASFRRSLKDSGVRSKLDVNAPAGRSKVDQQVRETSPLDSFGFFCQVSFAVDLKHVAKMWVLLCVEVGLPIFSGPVPFFEVLAKNVMDSAVSCCWANLSTWSPWYPDGHPPGKTHSFIVGIHQNCPSALFLGFTHFWNSKMRISCLMILMILTRWWQLKYSIIFTPIPGEMIQFDEHIFQRGWFNHQPEKSSW